MLIAGVNVIADTGLTEEEIKKVAAAEIEEWRANNKELSRLELRIDGEEIVVTAIEKSPIKRVRRITGYLSNIENFNEAKSAECRERKIHS